MKTSILPCLLISLLCLSSCDLIKPFIPPDEKDCILQKTVWDVPGDPAKDITEYSYDADGALREIEKTSWDMNDSPNWYVRWEISGPASLPDQIASYYHMPNQPEELEIEYLIFYTGDLPDSISYHYGQAYNYQTGYFKMQYNANNKLIQLVDNRYQQFNQTWSVTTTDLQWTGDNLTRMTTLDYLGSTTIREFEYDDKKRPLIHPGLAFSNYGALTMLSANNVVKSSRTNWDGSISTIVYTINYNDAGYPVSIDPDNDYPTTFQYSCK